MKIRNCASLIALVAGSISLAAPANAAPSELSISPASITASHDVLTSNDLVGGDIFEPQSHQQQQQQQQQVRRLASISGIVYGPSSNGFNV